MRRKHGERGGELVEFALVLLPLMMVMLLTLNICWAFFARQSLQLAVQAGIRYAVTGQHITSSQDADIKGIVQQNAMGFLNGTTGLNCISLNYYKPNNLTTPVTGLNSNAGGNVVEIKVQGLQVGLFPKLLATGLTNWTMGATAADVTESSPNGTPPSR